MQTDEYHKMAEVEDAMWYYRALHRHVIGHLAAGAPDSFRVLDAGCGTGGLLRRILREHPGWRATGLDFSPVACQLARARTAAEIVEGSVLALPFANAAFEAIASCDVLCQVDAPERALREFHRCLAPGGRLVLTMPAYAWMYSYHDKQVGNLRRYDRGEVLRMLHDAGFGEARGTYWNTLPFPLAVLRRKMLPPPETGSDVFVFPRPVEAVFTAMMAAEHAWLARGGRLPFGNSVLTVARK
ncbi:MAG TPA: class I SAM-dependent methyltransferase [Lacunisphaera sp.]|nr:class I SAM-dependent methyltransferase [Lacunisphaera sp.]